MVVCVFAYGFFVPPLGYYAKLRTDIHELQDYLHEELVHKAIGQNQTLDKFDGMIGMAKVIGTKSEPIRKKFIFGAFAYNLNEDVHSKPLSYPINSIYYKSKYHLNENQTRCQYNATSLNQVFRGIQNEVPDNVPSLGIFVTLGSGAAYLLVSFFMMIDEYLCCCGFASAHWELVEHKKIKDKKEFLQLLKDAERKQEETRGNRGRPFQPKSQ